MKLYWAPQTRSIRAIWMLEEAGVDYELELVDITAEKREDSEEFLTASPMGKVPALVDGDAALAESAAICLYVADRYAPKRLAPAIDDPLRGAFLYWLMYTPAVVEPAMSEQVNKIEPRPKSSGWGSFDSMISTWERRLADREWVVGGAFSAADVMLGSSAIFLRMFGMLPGSETLEAYADRCMARPAFVRAGEKTS
jgi:glutathione S-transferase